MMIRIGTFVIALALASGCKEDKPAGYDSPKSTAKAKPKAEPSAEPGSADTAKVDTGDTAAAGTQAEEGPPPTQVKIELRAAKVGSVITSESSSTTQIQFTGSAGRSSAVDATRNELRHIEVVEADGPAIRKAKVHYESQTVAQREGFVEQESGDVLHGLKFVVTSAGGKLTATTDTGAAVPADQLAEVIGDLEGELGMVPGMEQILFGRQWTYGVPVTLTADELKALSSEMPEGTRATAGTANAITQSKGIATFQLDLEIEIGEVGKNGFTVKSTATIDADIAEGRRLSRKATSTIDGTIDGMTGKGTLTESEALRYQ